MKKLHILSLDTIWFLIPILLVCWSALLHPLRHLDFWWHLKVGEIIIEQGHIPTTDIFSFTENGKSFTYQNWLAEVIFYCIWRIGGAELLVLMNTLLMVSTFLIMYATIALRASYTRLTSLLMLVGAVSLSLYSNLRTQTFSFLFFSMFLFILWYFYLQRKSYVLLLLPIIMVLWVNIHGAYTIGLITCMMYAGFSIAQYFLKSERTNFSKTGLPQIVIAAISSIIATFINPSGVAIYQSVQQVMMDPASQQFVTEWQPPRITNLEHLLVFFIPFLSVVSIFIYSQRKLDLASFGIFLLFTILGLTSVRNGVWFTIALIPVAAWHLENLSLPPVLFNNKKPIGHSLQSRLAAFTNMAILITLITITILFNPWLRPRLGIEALRPSLIDPRIPLEAIEYIARSRITGRIFHHQDFGDYMIWRLWPQQYTFVDGRVHLFSHQIVQDYLNAIGGFGWEEIMDKYNISYIFLPQPSQKEPIPLATDARKSVRWKLIYEDEKSVIFQRTDVQN